MTPRSNGQFKEMRDKSRHRIIEAALEGFATHGYHGTSIEKIANTAGISKGLMYNYYKSKSELLEAVIFGKMVHLMAGFMEDINSRRTPRAKLRQLIEASFAMMEAEPHYWRLYWSVLLDPKLPKAIISKLKDSTKGFTREMVQLLKDNGVKDAETEAHILLPTLDAINMMHVFNFSDYPPEKIKRNLIKKYCKQDYS